MFKSICKSIFNTLAVICGITIKHSKIVISANYTYPKIYDSEANSEILIEIEQPGNCLFDSDVLKMGFG